jgi:hypothetical protein
MQRLTGTMVRLGISIALLSLAAVFGQFHTLSPQAAAPDQVTGLLPPDAPSNGAPVLVDNRINSPQLEPGAATLGSRGENGMALPEYGAKSLPLCTLGPAQMAFSGISAWTVGPAGVFEPVTP